MNLRYYMRARKFRSKWDAAEIEWLMAHVGRGGVCFDIGAHKGGWTYWMRKAVGASGRVFAFEPQPSLNAYLAGLWTGGYWKNVVLEGMALSNCGGEAAIYVPGDAGATSAGASLKEEVLSHEADVHATRVATMRLDDYVSNAGVSEIEFIKVDVEGSEFDLVEGAERVLRDLGASWIIESEARHIGEAGVRALFEKMEAAGSAGYYFSRDGLKALSGFCFERDQRREGERYWDEAGYCNNFLFRRV
ncbi:MAG: FkbM family methyltransferase [Verrucomicrobiota bacterium]